jgi:hypothetical protein
MNTLRSRSLAALLAASVLASVAPVAAAPPPSKAAAAGPKPLAETLTGDAKSAYDSARVLFGDGDFGGALVKFQAAYDKSKDPRLLWNMGACEKNLRHYARTLQLVKRYAAEGGSALTAQDRKDADELVKAIEPLTASLEVQASEPGADVFVDDEKVGQTPLASAVVVDIGTRRVRVVKEGFKESNENVVVGGGPVVAIEAKLERVVHEGRLVVEAKPGDSIAIDGKVVGSNRYEGTLASGGHTLRVTAPGKRPYQNEVLVQDNQLRTIGVTLEAEPESSSGGVPAWVWVTGGVVAAAGLSTGAYFLFSQEKPADYPKGNLATGFVEASHPISFR